MQKSLVALAALAVVAISGPAMAQNPQLEQRITILEQQIDGLLRSSGAVPGGVAPDAALRLDQLENQVRTLTGQVEALRFELNQLRSGNAAQPQPQTRGDAFQPGTSPVSPNDQASLNAQAQALGSSPGFAQPGAVLQPQPGQQMPQDNSLAPLDLSGLGGISGLGSNPTLPGPANPALSPAANPQEAFDFSKIYIQSGEYDLAEAGFRQFIQTYPDNPLVPEARFWIGESQLQRQQYRQAAESFLTIYEMDAQGALVPDSLFKLGLALRELNAPQDACGAFAEAANHPRASGETRQKAREASQTLKCS